MPGQLLEARCLQVVQDLAREEGWRLPPEGIQALVEAILPFVQHTSDADDRTIRTIALNYYLDGPMVQHMLTPGSADGERLWVEWRKRLVAWAGWKGLPPEDADDLAQDAYIQTQKALRTFRFESRLKTYFGSIYANCYAYWRRRQLSMKEISIEGATDEGEMKEPEPQEEPVPLEDQVAGQKQNAAIRRLVEEEIRKIINHEDFQILLWYYVEETYIDEQTGETKKWTDEAIGERLGKPTNTVTSKRRRALQRLKNHPRLKRVFENLVDLDIEDAYE